MMMRKSQYSFCVDYDLTSVSGNGTSTSLNSRLECFLTARKSSTSCYSDSVELSE